MSITLSIKNLTIKETVKLTGTTLLQVEADMLSRGPKDQHGKRQYAVTAGTITSNLNFKKGHQQIRIIKPPTSISWGVKLKFGLQKVTASLTGETRICGLRSPRALSRPAQAEWKRFRGELEKHEREHYADSKAFAKDYIKGLQKIEVTVKMAYFDPKLRACDEDAKNLAAPLLEKEVLNLGKWIKLADLSAGVQLDLITDHGASRGAKLKTSIP